MKGNFMIKYIISTFLFCVLLIQSGCSGHGDWLVKKGFYSQVNKTELEKQKDDTFDEMGLKALFHACPNMKLKKEK